MVLPQKPEKQEEAREQKAEVVKVCESVLHELGSFSAHESRV